MTTQYEWALNAQKLQRAIASSKHKTEEEIKAEYLKIGGKVDLSDLIETKPMEEEKVEEIGVPPEGTGQAPDITEEVTASEPVEVVTEEEVTASEVPEETVTTTDDVS